MRLEKEGWFTALMYAWYKIILSPFFSPFFPSYTYSQLTFPLPQYFSFTSLALLILLPPFLSSIMGGFGTEVSYCWTSTKFGVLVFAVWCERYYDSCWSFSSLGHLFSTVTRPYSENVCDTAHVRFGLMILSHFVWANYVRVDICEIYIPNLNALEQLKKILFSSKTLY